MMKSILLSIVMLLGTSIVSAADLGTATIDITSDRRLTVEIVDVAGDDSSNTAYVTVAATNHPAKHHHCKPGTFCGKPKAYTRYATIAVDVTLLDPAQRDAFQDAKYNELADSFGLKTRVYKVKRVIHNPKNRIPPFNTLLDVTIFN